MEKEKEILSEPVPYQVFQGEMARAERHIKRLWIALLVCLAILFGTNIGWLIFEAQFDTYYYEATQDGEGLNNINVGDQGDVIYGADSSD